jgi:hypothetical protein
MDLVQALGRVFVVPKRLVIFSNVQSLTYVFTRPLQRRDKKRSAVHSCTTLPSSIDTPHKPF